MQQTPSQLRRQGALIVIAAGRFPFDGFDNRPELVVPRRYGFIQIGIDYYIQY